MLVQYRGTDAGQASVQETTDTRPLHTGGSESTDGQRRSERVPRRRRGSRDRLDASDVALLVEAASAGNQDAWNALVDRFASTVWAIARGHRLNSADAADVFQTTWLRLLEHLDRIEQPERVGAWIGTTARRECLRVLRISGRQVPNGEDFDVLPDPGSSSHSPDRDLIASERSQIVNSLVEQLPMRSQLLLRFLSADSPLSYRDISETLSMPIGSIGPTRARALEQLRRVAVAAGVNLEDVFMS
jgi:RNA polymerase sigma factor (sigma-70 family)